MSDCPTSAPVCDMNLCRACTANSECPSALCDTDAGTCFDSSALLYASSTGGAADPCTLVSPCSFDHALTLAMADQTRSTIKLAAGTYPTGGRVTSGTVTVYGEGSNTISGDLTAGGGTFRIRNLALTPTAIVAGQPTTAGGPRPTLDLDRVTWVGSFGNDMLYPNPAILNIRRSSFTCTGSLAACSDILYPEGVLNTTNGQSVVTIDQTTFSGGDPIMLFGYADLSITNSVFINAGPTYGAIQFLGGRPLTASIAFSTFHNARLLCPGGSTILASDSNVFVNDASGAPADTVTGTTCTHTYDLMKPQATDPGGAGNLLNVDPKFVNAGGGDFHLSAMSPAIDMANPTNNNTHDYDGTARPQGTRSDIGAFEYK
jgi:hypothetical protein